MCRQLQNCHSSWWCWDADLTLTAPLPEIRDYSVLETDTMSWKLWSVHWLAYIVAYFMTILVCIFQENSQQNKLYETVPTAYGQQKFNTPVNNNNIIAFSSGAEICHLNGIVQQLKRKFVIYLSLLLSAWQTIIIVSGFIIFAIKRQRPNQISTIISYNVLKYHKVQDNQNESCYVCLDLSLSKV